MKKIVIVFIICMTLGVGGVLAHHPAEEMVDDEIYAAIDEMVADTPHASMDFDDDGNTIITADSVSEAENLIDDGLLADLSLLDDSVTVTITFEDDAEQATLSEDDSQRKDRWTERDDWGGVVIFTIETYLCSDPPCKSEK